MARSVNTHTKETRPALTPEADQNQMISYAMNLVRKRLLEGTASSQETTHFLKLAATKEKLEMDNLRKDIELKDAKIEALHGTKRMEELYSNALEAMRRYSGNDSDIND